MAITGLEMADLVREVCHDGGTGPLVLGGAVLGYRGFGGSVGAGVAFPYAIVGVAHPAEWECGVGELNGEGRLVRSPASSSAGGAVVDFTAGEKLVVLTPHADWLAAVEAHGHGISEIDGLATALAGKQDAGAVLGALSALVPEGDRLAYWSGADTAALTALSATGRALIGGADAAAMRGTLGLGGMAVQSAAAVAISGGSVSGIVDLAVADGGTGASSAAVARGNLGLSIGSDVQAHNAGLDAIAALTTSGFGRGMLVPGDGVAMRAYIGAGTSSTTGTVTSVAGSGGATGLTMDGGPVTGAGTLTLGGTLAIDHGGTGAVTAAGARTALGLGTAAVLNSGTSGGTVALCNGSNSWSATQTFPNTVFSRVGQAAEVGRYLRSDAGYGIRDYYQTGTINRWGTGKNAVAESGSNAGSDFEVNRYDDSGTYLTTVVRLTRSSGLATFGHSVTLGSTSPVLTVGNGSSATLGSSAPLAWISARANSQSNAATTPQESLRLSWQEGSQDLGVGEGNAINFSASLVGDAGVFYPLCQIASYKETNSESDRRSSLIFSTSDDGAVAASEKMRITAASGVMINAVLQPLTDNARTLGTAAGRWSVVYAATGTINTSDARAKCDVAAVEAALLDAWGDVQWVTYRWRDAVAAKGDGARVHAGLMAQGVRDAIDARLGEGAGVRLGLLCRDDLPDGEARWGLRYDQCFALEAAWQRRRLDRIEARIAAMIGGGDDAG